MKCRHCGAPWMTEFAPCDWCGLSYQGQIAIPGPTGADASILPVSLSTNDVSPKNPPKPQPTSVPSSGSKVSQ
jgi:hypothetical protein